MNGDDKPRSEMGEAIRRAYRAGEEDEALTPIVKTDGAGRPVGRIGPGDAVIFYDLRGEREIEITQSLVQPDFRHFPVSGPMGLRFVTMIEYDLRLPVRPAFPKEETVRDTLVEVVGRDGMTVLKIAESEKAAHIGFFLNGRNDRVFPGEARVIIPSPEGLTNYDEAPGMSAGKVAEEISRAAADRRFDLVIANFANVDVVGHIEKREAVIAAVETVDRELGRVVEAARSSGATLIVTADHGTVEEWLYPDGQVNTGHTKNPVPFILADYADPDPALVRIRPEGELADVAPTVLSFLGLAVPPAMTGRSLLESGTGLFGARRRVILLILDGWGMRPESYGNLIAEADTPNFDSLWAAFPRSTLQASGEAVGMPQGTVGNSEAGHLHLGAGRRVLLDRVRIDAAIADGGFFKNPAFLEAMAYARDRRRPLHLMGIISHYSSHGTIRHLFALLELARWSAIAEVFIHGFIGRRGEKPESGAIYVEKVEAKCRELGLGEVVTVMGRYWSLDREENWDRVERAYRALVFGDGTRVIS
jgi:2,3-bisphosphoglycerate-independent phosphoglycerate mutase